jgi:hypothetical protein
MLLMCIHAIWQSPYQLTRITSIRLHISSQKSLNWFIVQILPNCAKVSEICRSKFHSQKNLEEIKMGESLLPWSSEYFGFSCLKIKIGTQSKLQF